MDTFTFDASSSWPRLPESIVLHETPGVAVDAKGKLFYRNEELTEAALGIRLAAAVTNAGEPITLVIQADKSVPNERLIQLGTLARKAGIHDAVLATLPRLVDAPAAPSKQ